MAVSHRRPDDVGMTTEQHPLEIYRRFQSYLLGGEFGRLGEVVDMDGYTENCVGLTGWTTGLATALRNFQANVASAFSDMAMAEEDVIESGDTLVIRSVVSAVHAGEFLGVAPDRAQGHLRRGRHVPGGRRPDRVAVPALRLEGRAGPAHPIGVISALKC